MDDLPGVEERVWAKVMRQRDLDHEKGTGTKAGLAHVVTGHLRHNWKPWAGAHVSREKLQWVKQGHSMVFTGPVPPSACPSNHKCCVEAAYAKWVFAILEEMLVLRSCALLGH